MTGLWYITIAAFHLSSGTKSTSSCELIPLSYSWDLCWPHHKASSRLNSTRSWLNHFVGNMLQMKTFDSILYGMKTFGTQLQIRLQLKQLDFVKVIFHILAHMHLIHPTCFPLIRQLYQTMVWICMQMKVRWFLGFRSEEKELKQSVFGTNRDRI